VRIYLFSALLLRIYLSIYSRRSCCAFVYLFSELLLCIYLYILLLSASVRLSPHLSIYSQRSCCAYIYLFSPLLLRRLRAKRQRAAVAEAQQTPPSRRRGRTRSKTDRPGPDSTETDRPVGGGAGQVPIDLVGTSSNDDDSAGSSTRPNGPCTVVLCSSFLLGLGCHLKA
jgi:hypothetical protein